MKRTLNQSFILNTLSTISYLSDTDTNLCKECISNLAKVLQCQMCEEKDKLHELDTELSVIRSFIEIENLRFNGNIKYIEKIENGNECLVPVGLILEAVQNAIEYRISKIQGGGTINIACKKCNDAYVLCVSDSGVSAYNNFIDYESNWIDEIKNEVDLLCAGSVVESKNENESVLTFIFPDL